MTFLEDRRKAHAANKPPAPPPGTFAPFPAGGNIEPYALAALNRECSNVAAAAEGSRNHTLNTAAYNLAQLTAAGKLPEAMVTDGLTAAARAAGLTETEITKTLASGTGAGAKQPRRTPQDVTTDWIGTLPERTPRRSTPAPHAGTQSPEEAPPWEEETHDQAVMRFWPRINWATLWADTTEQEWIVDPLLPARRLVALYSPPKTGKSLLMLEIAAAVSCGRTVLGSTPTRPYRVCYVDFENDPKDDIRTRLQAMGYTHDDLDNLVYLSFPTIAALDGERGSAELMAILETYTCEVVVIDTVSRAITGDENENDTWLNFYRNTGLKLKQAGISLIRLDHSGKDISKGQRGGSAKAGDVDAVWKLSTIIVDETYRLECELARMPIGEKDITLHRIPTPHLHHVVDGAGRYGAINAKIRQINDHLDSLGLGANVTNEVAKERLRTTGITARNNIIAAALRERKRLAETTPELPFLPYKEDE